MSTIILLRHAHSHANKNGILAGRMPGIRLSSIGKSESLKLVERLSDTEINYIHSSPLDRCIQTIDPYLNTLGKSNLQEFCLEDRLIEMDYGRWSGRKLSALAREPLWREIQTNPSKVTFPEGESFKKMQKRSLAFVQELLSRKGNENHLVITHGDLIKVITASLLGMKLDNFQKLVVDPASFTVFKGNLEKHNMLAFNDTESTLRSLIGEQKKDRAILGGGAGKE